MLVSHSKFIDCVNQSWNEDFALTRVRRPAFKIKRVKIVLKSWNFQVFGNIIQMRDKIQKTETELEGNNYDAL